MKFQCKWTERPAANMGFASGGLTYKLGHDSYLEYYCFQKQNEKQNEKQKDKQNEKCCVRDSCGKPGAVGNREDLERIARPEGARPKSPADKCFQRMPAANASLMSF